MLIPVFLCNALWNLFSSEWTEHERPRCILVSCAQMNIGIRSLACFPVGIPTGTSQILSNLMFKVAQREDLAMHPWGHAASNSINPS